LHQPTPNHAADRPEAVTTGIPIQSSLSEAADQGPVYIVLINFNGSADTIECVDSLAKLRFDNYRVIIVDNGSHDDSVARIRSRLSQLHEGLSTDWVAKFEGDGPVRGSARVSSGFWRDADSRAATSCSVTLMEVDQNLGFTGGNNAGMRYAVEEGCASYVWLLNNDTIVDPEALNELVRRYESVSAADPASPVALCGSLILDYDNPERVQAYGGAMVNRVLGTTRNLHEGEHAESGAVQSCETLPDYISGCSLLISGSNLARTGMFNPDYFLYWEDTEWSFRCKRMGMRLTVAPASRIWHRRGSTSRRFPVVGYYNTRNCLRFMRQYFPGYLVLCLLSKPFQFGLIAVKNANFRFFAESARGYWEFCKESFRR
jgi:GT2 family glycosyltransferase